MARAGKILKDWLLARHRLAAVWEVSPMGLHGRGEHAARIPRDCQEKSSGTRISTLASSYHVTHRDRWTEKQRRHWKVRPLVTKSKRQHHCKHPRLNQSLDHYLLLVLGLKLLQYLCPVLYYVPYIVLYMLLSLYFPPNCMYSTHALIPPCSGYSSDGDYIPLVSLFVC